MSHLERMHGHRAKQARLGFPDLEEVAMQTMTLLTYQELRDATGIPLGTLYTWVARRQIPHLRLGKRSVRFERDEIVRWLEERRVRAGLPAAS